MTGRPKDSNLINIKLLGLPKRTNNSHTRWQAKMNEARIWKSRVLDHVLLHRLAPTKPFKVASLICTRHSSTEPDFDGLVSSFKHVIDGLIHAGILENDKPSNIGQPLYRWEKAPRNKGFITVQILGKDNK